MSKSALKCGKVDVFESDLQHFTNQLSQFIDGVGLVQAYQTRRRSERLYAYHGLLRDACRRCFRGTNIASDSKKCVVWGFNGKVWVSLTSGMFRDVVGGALIKCSGSGDFVVKGDWMEKRAVMLESAYAGVCASPLEKVSSIVGFRNGVWDFGDVDNPVYHPFSDMMPVTDLLPYDYDPDAVCPQWLSFLNMMLNPMDVLKLQKYLGLGVVSRRLLPCVVESTLWLIGGGCNGKTTIENVVRNVYGYDRISESSMSALLDRNQISHLLSMSTIDGKLFNICSEVDLADITKGSDAFKKLCSGEPQNARGIGENIHLAYDIPFLIFSMNQRPSNKRMDAAFRRRIVEIQFNVTVRPEDMDPALGRKLEGELSGIRNWMIEGYKRLVADGFKFDQTTDEEYMESNEQYFDIFAQSEGLRPCAWAGHRERPQHVSAKVLHEKYSEFCQRNMYGAMPPSIKAMSQDMKRLNYKSVRRAAGMFYQIYSDRQLDYAV